MKAEDRLPINFRRVSSRTNNRRCSELRAMAANKNRDFRSQSPTDDTPTTSTRHLSLQKLENRCSASHTERRRYKYSPLCCVEKWKYHQKSIRKCVKVFLIIIAIFQMVCGMIFAAIHVVLSFSSDQVTNELQNPLPIYLSAAMVALSGLCDMVLSRIKTPYMILTGIFFSISSCVITLAGLLSSATVSLPKFSSFVKFQFDSKLQTCTAYTRWDKQLNGTFTGGITYNKISGCSLIESTLPPITVTLVIFYAIACFTSFVACFLLTILLCVPDNNKKLNRMESKESSYVNYDLELDNICDVESWRDESHVKSRDIRRDQNEGYLPGVTIPHYTLPYIIPLSENEFLRRTASCTTRDDIRLELTTPQTFSTNTVCGCSSGTVVSSVVSTNYSKATSATVGRHKQYRRPMLPLEFGGIPLSKPKEDEERLAGNDRDDRLPQHNMQSSETQHFQTKPLTYEPERQKNTIGKVEDIRRFQDKRGKTVSFNRDEESYSPPPYSELPDYESRAQANVRVLTGSILPETPSMACGSHYAGETIL
ncbi:uncharacterized protein LOC144428161 [Styela clava]